MERWAAVKKIRDALKLTQEEFGERIKLGTSTVQRYERAGFGPQIEQYDVLIDLAREAGRDDLADVFLSELKRKYGRFFDAPKSDWTAQEWRFAKVGAHVARTSKPGNFDYDALEVLAQALHRRGKL